MLDDLINTIKTVQARIQEHGDRLSNNEYRTRLSLIDPILNVLGWEVSDPRSVIPEYEVGNRRADYALLGDDGQPKALIEAKHLGEMANSNKHEDQVFDYAFKQKVKFAGLTDGDRWIVDDVVAGFSSNTSRLLFVTISMEPAYSCALKLLLLWKPSLAVGEPSEAKESIFTSPIPNDIHSPSPERQPSLPESQRSPTDATPTGILLSKYKPDKNKQKPASIHLPDGRETQLDYWVDILTQTAEWLIRSGDLTADRCPVYNMKNTYLVNTEPVDINGKKFEQHRKLSNGLFIKTRGDSQALIRTAQLLLKRCGQDPTSIFLKPS